MRVRYILCCMSGLCMSNMRGPTSEFAAAQLSGCTVRASTCDGGRHHITKDLVLLGARSLCLLFCKLFLCCCCGVYLIFRLKAASERNLQVTSM